MTPVSLSCVLVLLFEPLVVYAVGRTRVRNRDSLTLTAFQLLTMLTTMSALTLGLGLGGSLPWLVAASPRLRVVGMVSIALALFVWAYAGIVVVLLGERAAALGKPSPVLPRLRFAARLARLPLGLVLFVCLTWHAVALRLLPLQAGYVCLAVLIAFIPFLQQLGVRLSMEPSSCRTVEDEELTGRVQDLARRAGVRVDEIVRYSTPGATVYAASARRGVIAISELALDLASRNDCVTLAAGVIARWSNPLGFLRVRPVDARVLRAAADLLGDRAEYLRSLARLMLLNIDPDHAGVEARVGPGTHRQLERVGRDLGFTPAQTGQILALAHEDLRGRPTAATSPAR